MSETNEPTKSWEKGCTQKTHTPPLLDAGGTSGRKWIEKQQFPCSPPTLLCRAEKKKEGKNLVRQHACQWNILFHGWKSAENKRGEKQKEN